MDIEDTEEDVPFLHRTIGEQNVEPVVGYCRQKWHFFGGIIVVLLVFILSVFLANKNAPFAIVLQVTDDVSKYETWTQTVKAWTQQFNFTYVVKIFNETKWSNQLKPKLLLQQVTENMENGVTWMIFLDADICVKNFAFNMTTFLIQNSQYDFMFQDSMHTTNSGFLIIKNTDYSVNILMDWIENQNNCKIPWSGDQAYLQITILKYAFRSKNQDYNNKCCFMNTTDAHEANLCYRNKMDGLGFPVNERKFGKIMAIDHKTRFNMHDSGDHYKNGDIFYHGHDERQCK
jgi:hypothetical protein